MSDRIATGVYLIDAPCPRCGVIEEILVKLSAVLTTPEDDGSTIRVRLKGKARDHDCITDAAAFEVAES